jgi:peptidyl-prolyl cis-trans isomerase D
MLKTLQQRNRMVKIVLAAVVLAISITMVITLVPGLGGSMSSSPDAVATVGGQEITAAEVRRQLDQRTRNQTIPSMLKGFYAQQILDEMIFERALELEAKRLGLEVTQEEQAERIKQLLPMVFTGDTWVGKDRYALAVEQLAGMSVPEFEEAIRKSLLFEKFQQLITAGVTVSPGEVEQEFRRRNQKVKIEFALAKPADLAPAINPSDTELEAYFNKNASRYPVPEKRSAQFALLDLGLLRQKTTISDEELRAYYNAHLGDYKVQDRVHVEHILFKTVGKTDAEIAEIRKQAEDVLKKANHGGSFEDLAKKYSEDPGTKDKGGDLGWIVRGQTVPAFEQVAFSLPKGTISDLVKTEYGFHIIKVLDKEAAHTKSLDEVRATILSTLLDDKVRALANKLDDEMAATVRQSSSQSLDQFAKSLESMDPLARQCLVMGMTPLATMTEPVGDLGNSPELHDALFRLRQGELSPPLRLERGYAVLAVKQIEPAHPGKFAEVRDKVLADYRQEKAAELAYSRADELVRRVRAGEDFAKAAQALALEVKTSDSFARTGSIAGLGPAKVVEAAFTVPIGQLSDAIPAEANWLVYRVVAREEPNPDDLAKQRQGIEAQLLQQKRNATFDAFRTALEDRMRREGKLVVNQDAMKRLTSST